MTFCTAFDSTPEIHERLIILFGRIFIAPFKEDLFRGVAGAVLEIGPGPGSNLTYLPNVEHWVGVEPNRFMHAQIEAELSRLNLDGTILEGVAERLPFEDQTFDFVIGTLVLCSVASPADALAEIRRVLRPSGRYCFIEHVGAPRGTPLRRWQRRVRPIWRCCGDGCWPDRDTQESIGQAGFARVDYQEFRAPPGTLPAIVSPHICGSASQAD